MVLERQEPIRFGIFGPETSSYLKSVVSRLDEILGHDSAIITNLAAFESKIVLSPSGIGNPQLYFQRTEDIFTDETHDHLKASFICDTFKPKVFVWEMKNDISTSYGGPIKLLQMANACHRVDDFMLIIVSNFGHQNPISTFAHGFSRDLGLFFSN